MRVQPNMRNTTHKTSGYIWTP